MVPPSKKFMALSRIQSVVVQRATRLKQIYRVMLPYDSRKITTTFTHKHRQNHRYTRRVLTQIRDDQLTYFLDRMKLRKEQIQHVSMMTREQLEVQPGLATCS